MNAISALRSNFGSRACLFRHSAQTRVQGIRHMSVQKKIWKIREPIIKIDEGRALDDLREQAQIQPHLLRYRRDGSHYPKRKRSEGPVPSELANGVPVFGKAMQQAYNGYPDQVGATNLFLLLGHEFEVLVSTNTLHLRCGLRKRRADGDLWLNIQCY